MAEEMSKPVVAYVAGQGVPQGVRMGHAGAIVSGGMGSAAEKVRRLEAAGVRVAVRPSDAVRLVQEALDEQEV